jgi:hypothetical protein
MKQEDYRNAASRCKWNRDDSVQRTTNVRKHHTGRLWLELQEETTVILPETTEFNIFRGRQQHQGARENGPYEFKLRNTPKVERTKALLGHMTTGGEASKGQGSAVVQMAEIVISVGLDQASRNMILQVPNRITMEQLVDRLDENWERISGKDPTGSYGEEIKSRPHH